MSRRYCICFMILPLICVLRPYLAMAKSSQVASPSGLVEGMVLLWNNSGQIWTIDPDSGEKALFWTIDLDTYTILEMRANLDKQSLFTFELDDYPEGGLLSRGRVRQINLSTQDETIVFEQENIIGLNMSPTGYYAVAYYFPRDLADVRLAGPYLTCFLDLTAGDCTELGASSSGVSWIEDDEFTWTERNIQQYLISVPTLERRVLPQEFNSVAPIPNKPDQALVSLNAEGYGLLILDLATLETSEYETAEDLYQSSYAIQNIEFSTDGRYFLFQLDQRYIVMNYETREIVSEMEGIKNPQWLLNDESIITISDAAHSEYPNAIIRYDVQTMHLERLMSVDEAISIQVVN